MNEDKMRKAYGAWAYTQFGGARWAKGREWDAWQAATRAAVPAWQPIETAPRDGTVVLARIPDPDVQQAVMWSAKENCWVIQWDHWKLDGFDTPTHWMPLPEVE